MNTSHALSLPIIPITNTMDHTMPIFWVTVFNYRLKGMCVRIWYECRDPTFHFSGFFFTHVHIVTVRTAAAQVWTVDSHTHTALATSLHTFVLPVSPPSLVRLCFHTPSYAKTDGLRRILWWMFLKQAEEGLFLFSFPFLRNSCWKIHAASWWTVILGFLNFYYCPI